jgi:hypothetical protein
MAGTRIPKAELTGVYGALIKWMSRKMVGLLGAQGRVGR